MNRVARAALFAMVVAVFHCAAEEVAPGTSRKTARIFGGDLSLWDVFMRGGIVMWPILATAIVGVDFVIGRLIDLRRARHIPRDFDKDVVHVVDTRGVDAGLALCLEKKCSMGRVLYAALLRHGTTRQEMETAVSHEAGHVLYDLQRNTRMIGSMAVLALLLGLLGTCVGLIDHFDRVANQPELLTTGVAEALLTSALGLIVAIPLAFMFFHLRGKAGDIVREIDERGIDAIVTLDRKARQSMRLVEDIEDQIKTKTMPGVKAPDIEHEFEEEEGPIKSSITTPAHLPVATDSTAGKKP